MASYKELVVWQKSIVLVKQIYLIVKKLPRSEDYGLSSQLRRASISIPSNIAEGYGRKSNKERKHFLSLAMGSAREVETQLILLAELDLGDSSDLKIANDLLLEILKMLSGLSKSIL